MAEEKGVVFKKIKIVRKDDKTKDSCLILHQTFEGLCLNLFVKFKILLFNGSLGDPTPYFKHNWLYEFKLFESTLFITVSGRIFDAH